MSGGDPFPAFYESLEARHLADLKFAEVRRALQALSSLYVERRERMRGGNAFEGRGKRAAFALYYAPVHFLVVRAVVRALGPAVRTPRRIVDLGCGTGTAGAAWALECHPVASVEGVDLNAWALSEARWTLGQLGVHGRASRSDAISAPMPRSPAGLLAAYTVNELEDAGRSRLLPRLLDAAGEGVTVLVIEPLARRANPWWPDWAETVKAAGGREDEWRFPAPALPKTLALLGKASTLDTRRLAARSLSLGFGTTS
jgi:hypothetical protein